MRDAAALAVGVAALAASVAIALAAEATPGDMVSVPAGPYRPFLHVTAPGASSGDAAGVRRVGAFRLGVGPVTNAEFLAFVVAHPQWRKSQIKAVFADEGYLRRWPSDLALADETARNEPVTNVSWFAAEAYCKAQGLRLPTTDQWEYALADSGRGAAEVRERSLEWFALPNERPPGCDRGRSRQRLRCQGHGRPCLGMDARLRRLCDCGGRRLFLQRRGRPRR